MSFFSFELIQSVWMLPKLNRIHLCILPLEIVVSYYIDLSGGAFYNSPLCFVSGKTCVHGQFTWQTLVKIQQN